LNSSPEQECYFDLIQDNRQLRLIPLPSSETEKNSAPSWDARSLEEMVVQVLSAQWDVQLDDDCPF
jgi:hypothetical protein